MNGIHDMGGMHGFGSIDREENEPVFHAPWEGRVLGMVQHGPVRVAGGFRSAIERIPPARYLSSSYYERWLIALEETLVGAGVLTPEELDERTAFFRGHPDAVPPRREDRENLESRVRPVFTHRPPHREVGIVPRFAAGDSVRARNINPAGHTRIPRYVRGKQGVIDRTHGVHDFQDTVLPGVVAQPQPVYGVRFDAVELWGDSAEDNGSVYVDMWESYLEPVGDRRATERNE